MLCYCYLSKKQHQQREKEEQQQQPQVNFDDEEENEIESETNNVKAQCEVQSKNETNIIKDEPMQTIDFHITSNTYINKKSIIFSFKMKIKF